MVNCCVLSCTSNSKKKYHEEGENFVSFHTFPCDPILQELWLKAISRKDFVVNDKSNSSRVCSKHFKSEDFINFKNMRRLKAGSIPSLFDNSSTFMQTSTSCSGPTQPKKVKLESSEMMEVQENYTDLTANKETSSDPEISVPSMKKKMYKKDLALKAKSKILDTKILEIRRLKRQLKTMSKKLQNVSTENKDMENELNYYKKSIHHETLKKLLDMERSGSIEPKQVFLLTQLKFMFSQTFRWPESVLKECKLLQEVSPRGYRTLIERDLVNLPSTKTLKRYTGPVINEMGVSPLIEIGTILPRLQEEAASLEPEKDSNIMESSCYVIISYHIETQTDPELFDACDPIFCRSPRSCGDGSFIENNNDKATQTDDLEGALENCLKKYSAHGQTQNCFKKDHEVKNQKKKMTFENIQLDDLYEKDKTETLKDIGGVAAGSLASAYQRTLGGTVAAGSAFAVCQSKRAAGMAASTQAAIVAGSGALVSAHSAECNFIRKKIK